MDETGIELTGARGFADGMRHLADLLDGEVPDVRREALAVADLARHLAPIRTGRLARSVRIDATPQGYEVTAGGPSVRYAAVQEYGPRSRAYRAHPYLRPAITQRTDAARDAWERDIATAIARQEWRD